MVSVNRDEWQTLQNLQAALAAGLDPSFAMGVYSDVTGQAMQRHEERRAQTDAEVQGLYDLATQLAQQGASQSGVQGAVLDRGAAILPQSPYAQKQLAGVGRSIMDMYGGQDISGLVPADVRAQLGAEGSMFSGDDAQFISEQVKGLVAQAQQEMEQGAEPSTSVIQARELLRSMFSLTGAAPEDLQRLDQYVTDQWYGYGGPGPGMQGLRPQAGETTDQSGGATYWDNPYSGLASGSTLNPLDPRNNDYSRTYMSDDPSTLEKLINTPRSLMDNILGWLD